jgi:hypothetical protein
VNYALSVCITLSVCYSDFGRCSHQNLSFLQRFLRLKIVRSAVQIDHLATVLPSCRHRPRFFSMSMNFSAWQAGYYPPRCNGNRWQTACGYSEVDFLPSRTSRSRRIEPHGLAAIPGRLSFEFTKIFSRHTFHRCMRAKVLTRLVHCMRRARPIVAKSSSSQDTRPTNKLGTHLEKERIAVPGLDYSWCFLVTSELLD